VIVKFAFIPVSVAGGLLAGFMSKKVFEQLWGLADDVEPPDAKHRHVDYRKLVAALLIEGAIFRLVRGAFDHGSRHGFAKLTGSWPGEEAPEPE
jgi:Protein of unknown function (DUF4235)